VSTAIPLPPDALWRGFPDVGGRPRGAFPGGIPGVPASRIWKMPGSDANLFNSSPLTVPAYPKVGCLIAMTSTDGSDSPPIMVGPTGWLWSRIWEVFDGTNTQAQAIWIGRPDPALLKDASGTSISLQGTSFSSIAIAQFYGSLRGDVVAHSEVTVASGAGSQTISSPTPYIPGTICIACGATRSGGAGINLGTDPLMPDLGTSGGMLAACRVGNATGPYSTTFTRASGTNGMNSFWILVR